MDRVKLPFAFDVEKLQHDLKIVENSDWIDHFVKQNYQGDWQVLPLRGPASAEHPVMMIYSDPTCSEFSDTPYLERCPYFRQVLMHFDCELHAVRLMKLTPGSKILEHRDHDLSIEDGAIRLHIPVTTNPNVVFKLNGSEVSMQPGECWYLRLSDPHSVVNNGDTDRVHLVIDAPANELIQAGLLQL